MTSAPIVALVPRGRSSASNASLTTLAPGAEATSPLFAEETAEATWASAFEPVFDPAPERIEV